MKKKTPLRISSSRQASNTDWARRCNEYAKRGSADKSGKTVGKWVRLACDRHLNDLKRQRSPKFPYHFDESEVARACIFFSNLPHVEGNWDTDSIVLEDWQIFIIGSIYGWRRENGTRRFHNVYEEVARKNAKSTMAAGIGLYCLGFEGEKGAQVKCAATTGKQARIVFNTAKAMVDRRPKLKKLLQMVTSMYAIACHLVGGNMEPINAKASSQEGLNPHCAIIDELHLHKSRKLWDTLRAARGARKNPLTFAITTAGDDTHGVCFEQRLLVTKILQGVIEAEHYFGIIFTLDDDDDPFDERTWVKANPNMGASISLTEMQEYAKEAAASPASAGEFKTKRLNIWTTARDGYLNVEKFKACAGKIDLAALQDVPCWAGLDLASTNDMASFRLAWKVDGKYITYGHFYLPEAAVGPRTERSGAPYSQWVEEGHITITPGPVTDFAYIEKDIRTALSEFNIQAIAYDPWEATYIVTRLLEDGAPMVEFRQGPKSYNAPMKEIDRAYLAGNFTHEGNPVLVWNASNLVARPDVNQNIAPDKKNSFEKIDGIVALYEAVGIMLAGEAPDSGISVYEQRGLAEIAF